MFTFVDLSLVEYVFFKDFNRPYPRFRPCGVVNSVQISLSNNANMTLMLMERRLVVFTLMTGAFLSSYMYVKMWLCSACQSCWRSS